MDQKRPLTLACQQDEPLHSHGGIGLSTAWRADGAASIRSQLCTMSIRAFRVDGGQEMVREAMALAVERSFPPGQKKPRRSGASRS